MAISPFVLITAANITCGHGGKVDFSTIDTQTHKLTIGGIPAVLETDVVKILGCTNPAGVCTAITIAAGRSAKLKVGGKAVVLSSLKASTSFAPALTLLASPTKLKSE